MTQIKLQNIKEIKDIQIDLGDSTAFTSIDTGYLTKVKSNHGQTKPSTHGESVSPRRTTLLNKFSAENFFEGQPELRVRFTEVVRKFNHELMKSTCQVMKGCKSWTAKQISDAVFELLNEILTHISSKEVLAKSGPGSNDHESVDLASNLMVKKVESVSSSQ